MHKLTAAAALALSLLAAPAAHAADAPAPATCSAAEPACVAAPSLLADAPAGGGACTRNDQCAATDYCATLFGECGKSGRCSPRPADCHEHGRMIVKPVCGCDGKTYDNVCLAAAAGSSVAHDGKCTAEARAAARRKSTVHPS